MGASAIGTSSVGAGVMPAQVLGGPIWWFFFGLYVLTIIFAFFTLGDSLRPDRKARFERVPEPRWLYTGFSAVYLVCVFAAWIPGLPRVLTAVPVGLALPMLVAGFAYLLRVVFPNEPAATSSPGVEGAEAKASQDVSSDASSEQPSQRAEQADDADSYFDL